MQYEPQGDLDFYTPTGNINLTGNRGIFTAQDTFNLVSNTTRSYEGISLQAPNVNINLSRTGSAAGTFRLTAPGFAQDVPGMLLTLGTGSYGSNPTVANMIYTGDDAFFSAVGNFYIKNVYNNTGSITVWSENKLQLRGDTGVRIQGDSFANPNDPIDININGSTFMDSYTSGIMAFQPQIGTYTRVSQYQKAFVEDPLVINNQGTVEIETGATLRITNPLGETDLTNYIGDATLTGNATLNGFTRNNGNLLVETGSFTVNNRNLNPAYVARFGANDTGGNFEYLLDIANDGGGAFGIANVTVNGTTDFKKQLLVTGENNGPDRTLAVFDGAGNILIDTLNPSLAGIFGYDVALKGIVKLSDKTGGGNATSLVAPSITGSLQGSVNITDTMNLASQDPLPAGNIGDLAVSGSNLFFYNGAWTQVI
jgi:hypothetical protein